MKMEMKMEMKIISTILLLILGRVCAVSRALLPGVSDELSRSSIKAANHVVRGRRLESSELSYVYLTFYETKSCKSGAESYVEAYVLDLCITYIYEDSDTPSLDGYEVYAKTELSDTSLTVNFYTDGTCTEILSELSELKNVMATYSTLHRIGDEYVNGTLLSSYSGSFEGTGTYSKIFAFNSTDTCLSVNDGSSLFSALTITTSTGISYPTVDAVLNRYYASSDTNCAGTVYEYNGARAGKCFSYMGNYTLNLGDSTFSYSGCSDSTAGMTMGPYSYVSCSYNTEDDDGHVLERGYYSMTAYYASNSSSSSTVSSSSSPTSAGGVLLSAQTGFLLSMVGVGAHAAIVLWQLLGSESKGGASKGEL